MVKEKNMPASTFNDSTSTYCSFVEAKNKKTERYAEIYLKNIYRKIVDHIQMKHFLEPREVQYFLKRLNKLTTKKIHLEKYRKKIKGMLLSINETFTMFEEALSRGEVSLGSRNKQEYDVMPVISRNSCRCYSKLSFSEVPALSSLDLTDIDFKTLHSNCSSNSSIGSSVHIKKNIYHKSFIENNQKGRITSSFYPKEIVTLKRNKDLKSTQIIDSAIDNSKVPKLQSHLENKLKTVKIKKFPKHFDTALDRTKKNYVFKNDPNELFQLAMMSSVMLSPAETVDGESKIINETSILQDFTNKELQTTEISSALHLTPESQACVSEIINETSLVDCVDDTKNKDHSTIQSQFDGCHSVCPDVCSERNGEHLVDELSVLLGDVELNNKNYTDSLISQDMFISRRGAAASALLQNDSSFCSFSGQNAGFNSIRSTIRQKNQDIGSLPVMKINETVITKISPSNTDSENSIANKGREIELSSNLMFIGEEMISKVSPTYNKLLNSANLTKLINKDELKVSFKCRKSNIRDLCWQLFVAKQECMEFWSILTELIDQTKVEILSNKIKSLDRKNKGLQFPEDYEHHYGTLEKVICEHRLHFSNRQKLAKETESKFLFDGTINSWQELQVISENMKKRVKENFCMK